VSAPSHSHSKAARVVFLLFRVSGQSLKDEHGVKLVTFLETLSKETDPDTGERKLIQTEPLKGVQR
jgi:hypothetical protein